MPDTQTVKQCVIDHLLIEIGKDADGRAIGMSYDDVRSAVRREMPIILYKGPHYGKPNRITKREIQRAAYELAQEVRVPLRPRQRKQ